ncbi:MAG: ATP-grasp domain-containing protein [Clostridiales Family XIII bacterium]|jgi:carbamoylphosphate synthase large subunit|nr:ATP-grasp domain-containing protein [Clostridiales Family XIII bacterium]
MRTVRVWLNHWFSTAYHIIELIKRDTPLDFIIIASNREANCVYRAVCDEFYIEPEYINKEQYTAYCLDFCREHSAEVFVPRRAMSAIAERRADFDALGVKVLAENDTELLSTVSDKAAFYQACSGKGIGCIPPYMVVDTVTAFERAYSELKTNEIRVCFKFARDEGAASFRVIDDRILDNGGLRNPFGTKITYGNAVTLLTNTEQIPPIILMPYLSGAEVSADCLRTLRGDIIIPRFKTNGRAERVCFDKRIIDICKRILENFSFECPVNIQFKYDGDTPYLLEVNARMSGGIQLSCLAADVNIPNIAVNKLLGIDKPWIVTPRDTVVSFVETPIEVTNAVD